MFRSLRALSYLRRSHFRPFSSLPKEDGTFHVRHVRIVRPFFTARRFKSASFWLLTIVLSWRQLGSLLDEEEEEEDKTRPRQVKEAVQQVKKAAQGEKLGADGGEASEIDQLETHATTQEVAGEDDEDDIIPEELPDDALFIPIGWPRQGPQTYYKGSDPEWQSFIEFARDQKRVKNCKDEVAAALRTALSKDRQMQRVLGTPISVGVFWLNIDYPYGPPPEYERPGIEITDDYIALTVRPVNEMNVLRLQRAVQPVALVNSLWASYKVVWDSGIKKVKDTLDMEEQPEAEKPRLPPGYGLFPDPMDGIKERPKNKDPKAKEKESSQPNSVSRSLPPREGWIKLLPSIPVPGPEVEAASREFRKALRKNLSQGEFPPYPPRGAVRVQGWVELRGPKASCTFDVLGDYEPGVSQWRNLGASMRRVQPMYQKPKGDE